MSPFPVRYSIPPPKHCSRIPSRRYGMKLVVYGSQTRMNAINSLVSGIRPCVTATVCHICYDDRVYAACVCTKHLWRFAMIIAQISDSHITHVGGKADRKYETATHLQRAVA